MKYNTDLYDKWSLINLSDKFVWKWSYNPSKLWLVYKFKSIHRRRAEDSLVLSSGTFGWMSWNLFIMLSQLKKLFSRASTKEKDKKTGILKNAALKIIWWKINMAQFIGNEKINNKFDISRWRFDCFLQSLSSSLLKCLQFQIFYTDFNKLNVIK